jgi:hypothetical protein
LVRFVLSILWGWFVVPLGVRAINVPWAIGLCLIINHLTTAGIRKRKSDPWTGAEIAGAVGGTFLPPPGADGADHFRDQQGRWWEVNEDGSMEQLFTKKRKGKDA